MLKLPSREIPMVQFRRELPEYLAGGKPCFIEVDARAAGVVNLEYMAGIEENVVLARISGRRSEKMDDPAQQVRAEHAGTMAAIRGRFAVLHDACIIAWRCNILSDGAPIACDRDTFLALAEVRVPEIAAAIADLERECILAGELVKEDQDATVKN